jgi:hypothetical protein
MNLNLNDALIAEKYPEVTNRLFDGLFVPFGFIKNNMMPTIPTIKNDHNEALEEKECIEESIYDALFELAKFKLPKRFTKKKRIPLTPQKSPKRQKSPKSQKNAKKREKIITQFRSTF